MRYFLVGLAFLLVTAPGAAAMHIGDYSVAYDIQTDGTVKEFVNITFSGTLETKSNHSIKLGEASSVMVEAGGTPLEIELEGGLVRFAVPEGTGSLLITFTTSELVFQRDSVSHFFAEFTPPHADRLTITVALPRGFILHDSGFFPGTGEISSDGERIKVSWTYTDVEGEAIPASVRYESLANGDVFTVPAILAAAAALVAVAFIFFRRKSNRQFLLTYFEDERKVIQALMEEKVAYQNTLERKLGFSRAKMTRVVQKLEKQGLVRKEKAGRTNRLTWEK